MAKPAQLARLRGDERLAEAGRVVIASRTAELFNASTDVLDLGEIDGVHDMRVATRRLRAALEVFAAGLPRRRLRRALREVKALADALGERRDRDVAIETLEALRAAASVEQLERDAVERLLVDLRREQRAANRRLRKAIRRIERDKLHRRLRRLVA